MEQKTFTLSQLSTMNNNPKFGNSNWIIFDNKYNNTNTFILHATNNNSLSGRKYIALPSNTNLTTQIIKNYNILK